MNQSRIHRNPTARDTSEEVKRQTRELRDEAENENVLYRLHTSHNTAPGPVSVLCGRGIAPPPTPARRRGYRKVPPSLPSFQFRVRSCSVLFLNSDRSRELHEDEKHRDKKRRATRLSLIHIVSKGLALHKNRQRKEPHSARTEPRLPNGSPERHHRFVKL